MAQTNVNIRMDSDLKTQFEAFCTDMGMTMTTAFTVFAKKAVREYRIPFEIGCRSTERRNKKSYRRRKKRNWNEQRFFLRKRADGGSEC